MGGFQKIHVFKHQHSSKKHSEKVKFLNTSCLWNVFHKKIPSILRKNFRGQT